jgi:hypothetical protein
VPPRRAQCDWCGALNELTGPPPPPDWLARGPRAPQRPRRAAALGCALAAAVLAMVAAVAAIGVAVVLPDVAPPAARAYLLYPAAALCVGQIAASYARAALRHPGPVAPGVAAALRGAGDGRPPRGALRDHCWCRACAYAKPKTAHHCRRCATCIDGLDHHCVYLGACVGAANGAAFAALLRWLLAGAAYSAAACAAMAWRRRRALWAHSARVWASPRGWSLPARALTFSLRWVLAAQEPLGWLGVAGFASAGAAAATALLLARHESLARRAETHLEVLGRRRGARRRAELKAA